MNTKATKVGDDGKPVEVDKQVWNSFTELDYLTQVIFSPLTCLDRLQCAFDIRSLTLAPEEPWSSGQSSRL